MYTEDLAMWCIFRQLKSQKRIQHHICLLFVLCFVMCTIDYAMRYICRHLRSQQRIQLHICLFLSFVLTCVLKIVRLCDVVYFQTTRKPAADTTSYLLASVRCFDMCTKHYVILYIFRDLKAGRRFNFIFVSFCLLF